MHMLGFCVLSWYIVPLRKQQKCLVYEHLFRPYTRLDNTLDLEEVKKNIALQPLFAIVDMVSWYDDCLRGRCQSG